jgi:hypothetical protein
LFGGIKTLANLAIFVYHFFPTAISAIPIARAVIVVIIAVLVAFPIRRAALAAFFGTFLYLGFAIFAFALRAKRRFVDFG